MATLVAGLPQYMVLRSRRDWNHLQYMWDEEEFGEFHKFMGTKRAVDPVSPFTKLEVVVGNK